MNDPAPMADPLFRLAGVGVVQTDLSTGRFVRVNRAFCDMVGYSEAELLELTYLELTHPDDRARDAASFAVLQQGEQQSGRSLTRVLHQDGSVVWLELAVTVLGEDDGAVNLAVVHDVTERQQAEAALRASEARFRAFVTASSEVVYRMSPDWSQMRELDGRGFLADTPRPADNWMAAYIHPDDQEAVQDAIDRALRAKRMFALEHRVVRADGTLGWTLSRAVPVLNEQGEVAEWLGAASDVTGRRRAEAALSESEAKYRTIFASVDEGFCVIDMQFDEAGRVVDGLVLETNPAFTRMTGLEGAAGRTARQLIPEMERYWWELYAQVAMTGEAARVENYSEPTGRWYEVHVSRVGGPQSRRIAIVFNDVSERKQAEAALKDLNHTLEQRVEERTEALKRSEQRFSQAFYSNPIPACMTTFGKETFVEVNEALLALTGYERDEVVGKTAFELGMWSSPDDRRKLDEAQRDERGFHNLELQLRHREGHTHDILLSAEVIRLDGHEGYLKMFYDITERKESEELLLEAVQEVMSDTSWFSRRLLERLANIRSGRPRELAVTELSQRERQVLERVAKGLNNDAIATELQIKPQTVRNYITNVYGKIGVRSRSEAIVWARERGII